MEDEQSNSMTEYVNVGDVKLQSVLNEEDFVYINVCGMMFETLKSTLEQFPSTLLGNKKRRDCHFVKCKNAYFFDRHRQSFEAIIHYYQTGGCLVRPSNIPMHLFEEEVSYFDLGKDVILHLREQEGYINKEVHELQLPNNYWQRKNNTRIWKLSF